MINIIKKLINRIVFPNTCDNEHFIDYLRKNGAKIGNNTRFIDPKRCSVDPGRIDYIEIGSNCCLSVVSIIAHDYSWYVFAESHHDILPDSGANVKIGNNCFIGYQACILKGTEIGDNVIVGARSVVKGNIPSGTVWAGIPAKQICTLQEYFERKSKNRIIDALYRRDHIRKTQQRNPTIYEMGFFSILFLERNGENYDKYLKILEFNGVLDNIIIKNIFFNSKPLFTFREFLDM